MKTMKIGTRLISAALIVALCCGQTAAAAAADTSKKEGEAEQSTTLLLPEASGKKVQKNTKAVIDYSNVADGYVMVQYTAKTDRKLAVQISKTSGALGTYTYFINQGEWTTFSLTDGDGTYKVMVLEQNPATGKYAVAVSANIQVKLKDELTPYLRPNQYVNYGASENTIAKAAELTKDLTEPLDKVKAIYEFVVGNLTYDKDRASAVTAGQLSGYLPVVDSVLSEKKGICFDYAALMTSMLRSQGIPCKLVTGYVPQNGKSVYHAWISVWTEKEGWISNVIHFDGNAWHRMDPTFASSSKSSASVMKYIGDGTNYTVKYYY